MFMRMTPTFSSRLACTPNEVVVVVSMEDQYYVQNLYVAQKMDLVYEVTRRKYQAYSLLSMVAAGRGDVLDSKNSYKEMDIWKGKCKTMGHKLLSFRRIRLSYKRKLTMLTFYKRRQRSMAPLQPWSPGSMSWRLL